MRGIREIRAGFFRSAGILVLTASMAQAQGVNFALPAQPLSDSLKAVAQQTGQNILFTPQAVAGLVAPELHGQMSGRDAVNALIKGTNLGADPDGNGGLIVHVVGSAPRDTPARSAGGRIAPVPGGAASRRRSAGSAARNRAARAGTGTGICRRRRIWSSRSSSAPRAFRSAAISSPRPSR